MPENNSDVQISRRPAVKLDFTSGLDKLPPRPKVDSTTTIASVTAGRELGFSGRTEAPADPAPVAVLDGRRLRSRGANTQLNLKITSAEKEAILRDAARFIQDPSNRINNIGEFVVHAVSYLRAHTRSSG